MSSSTKATIRYATVEDVPEILAMIRELAIYEKELDSCHATEELLSRSFGFIPGEDGKPSKEYAKSLLIIDEDKVAGMAVYFYNFSTWTAKPGVYLEALFVRPQFRKRGYGTALLAALAKEVIRIDGGRLDFSVLKWNEPSIQLYKSLGAASMDEWVGQRVEGEGLKNLGNLGPEVNLRL